LYISQGWRNRPEYNDNPLPYDEEIYSRLRKHGESSRSQFRIKSLPYIIAVPFAGIDDLLAKHVSHLFIRDPIVVFNEMVDQDDSISSDHFEVCQQVHLR
jgi:glutamate--cysteine ligase catalytic subunit